MTIPLLSVLIPSYNYARYLPGCIASVLEQSRSDFEIVIVDNGSTDDTPARAAELRDPRIRYLRLEPKVTLVECHNRCFREARGRLAAVLNPDDLWEPAYLQKVLGVFEHHPEVGYVATDCLFINAEGRSWGQSRYDEQDWILPGPEAFRRRLRPDGRFEDGFSGQVMFRRDVLERLGGYRPDLELGHDLELWLRFELAGYAVGYLAEPLVRVRMHPQGHSISKRGRICGAMESLVREYLAKFQRRWPGQWDRRVWLPALYRSLYLTAHHYGCRRDEVKYLLKWAGTNPRRAARMAADALRRYASRMVPAVAQ